MGHECIGRFKCEADLAFVAREGHSYPEVASCAPDDRKGKSLG